MAQEGHGWFVLENPSKDSKRRATIAHVPPADQLLPRGTVRTMVQGLNRAPDRLAWSRNTMFILMPPERVAEHEVARRVFTLSATAGVMAGWEYVPRDRPETLPMLDGKWGARDLEVIGFAATPASPVVLMRRTGAVEDGEYVLVMLAGSAWLQVSLPWDSAGAAKPGEGERCRLITAVDGFGVLVERSKGGVADWYAASVEDLTSISYGTSAALQETPAVTAVRWTTREVRSDAGRGGGEAVADWVYFIENQLVRLTLDGKDATISVLQNSDEYVVATVKDVGSRVSAAPVDGNPGFLALLSETKETRPDPTDLKRASEAMYRLVEVTPGGRVLFDGQAKQGGPVSRREIELLLVMMVMVMGAVVVFVLKPDRNAAHGVMLPAGCIPAEGGRRVMATLVDLGMSWVLASLAMRVDVGDIARPDVLFGSDRGWKSVLAALGMAIGVGAVMEWQFGLTLGKLLLGCRVLSVHESPTIGPEERAAMGAEQEGRGDRKKGAGPAVPPSLLAREGVTLGAALWRNVAKWTPWNLMEFLATVRQRPWSDRVAGTMVVVLQPKEPEPEQ